MLGFNILKCKNIKETTYEKFTSEARYVKTQFG